MPPLAAAAAVLPDAAAPPPAQGPSLTNALHVLLPLLLLAALAGEALAPPASSSAAALRARPPPAAAAASAARACVARKSAAVVFVSYQPSSKPALPVFERGLRNMARFWPQPSAEVDIFVADNNAEDAGSAALLRNASLRAFGDASALRVVPNEGLAEGFRFVFGGLRAVILKEGWDDCFPYNYLTVMHSAMALLKKLPYEQPDAASGAFREDFRPFIIFNNIGYKKSNEYSDWLIREVEAAGVPLGDASGRLVLDGTGVFATSFVMSRTCLRAWLDRRIFVVTPRVEKKLHDMSTEALVGILATALCEWKGESFDGTLERYMADCRGGGEGCKDMTDAQLGDRTIMKVWGTA